MEKFVFNSWIRRTAYWTLDFVHSGGVVRKAYKDIDRMQNESMAVVRNVQKKRSTRLIEYAKAQSPYYSKTLKDAKRLEDCPVVDKNVFKENYDDILSREYVGKKLHTMTTSGSTGTPFIVPQNAYKRKRVLAELIYFNETVGNRVGDKFYFFRVWTEKNRLPLLKFWMQNEVPIDILKFSDENFAKIVKRLKRDKKTQIAGGYVSTFVYLADYLEKHGVKPEDIHLRLLSTGSEIQSPETRKRLKKVFGAEVASRYANQENGLIAQQCLHAEEFHVNNANYVVEILKMDSDEPAEYGELGRVVVTDIWNYAFPMIRYDTGDLAMKQKKSYCGRGNEVISDVQGRRADVIYDTSGGMLSPLSLDIYLYAFDKLKQWYFIQTDKKDYILKVNGAKGVYTDKSMIDFLKTILGDDANITIEHVTEIPHLSSGKYKQMECLYKPEK